MKQEELIKSCSILLYKLCDLVEMRNSLNFYDINISSEYFFIPLLNHIFDCELYNINTDNRNSAVIDLADDNSKLSVQVTSDSSAAKIHKTLKEFREHELYNKYSRLVIIVIKKKHTYKADFSKDIEEKFEFSSQNDIISIDYLLKKIQALSIDKIQTIQKYLEFSLDTMLDENQVQTIEQSFDFISQNTNSILNESFFEIDYSPFITEFKRRLDESDVVRVSSLSIEEGRYCILNLLHKERPDDRVYVIKSKESWNIVSDHLKDCILIPDFTDTEIPAIQNNKTIFIQRSDYDVNTIKLPRRTISFLSQKLTENGYSEPNKLIIKTQGLYYYLKKELFTGIPCPATWENDNDKSVLVAVLLGKWTEYDGDKEIIENLYGDSYENFILYLDKYIDIEDAFVVCKRSISYNVSYDIADPLLAVCTHKNISNLPIIGKFWELAKNVITDRDPLFDEPFENHYYLSSMKNAKYSNSLKSGILRTMLLLAISADCQEMVSHIVKDILSWVTSVRDWAYISQFFGLLGEAAPESAIEVIENSMDNHTGLLDLFTIERSAAIWGRHYYTNILWFLERLLSCKKYVISSINILLALGDHIDECSISNSPRKCLSELFCTWYNLSVLSVEDKIECARNGVEKYTYFWDIIFNEINNHDFVTTNSSFMYREPDEITQYTYIDQNNICISYNKILLDNIKDYNDRLIKILNLLPDCTEELFFKIKTVLSNKINDLQDPEKEQIKTELRKIIYRHRHFADAEWAAEPERISKIEEICLDIKFDDPAYDFLYLICSGEIPILNPVIFDSCEDFLVRHETAIEETLSSEFKKFISLGVDLGHFLSLRKYEFSTYNPIWKNIAKYYCNFHYDENVLDTIIKYTNNPQAAVTYVLNCSGKEFNEIYKAIDHLRDSHATDDYYVAFISALPFNEKTQSYILDLTEEAVRKYWTYFNESSFKSKILLNTAIENLLKYSNWSTLFFIIHENIKMLSSEEVLTIISTSTIKMIDEKHTVKDDESYFIIQILSIIYQRINNDLESYPILLEIEIRLHVILGWNNMKYCHYVFSHDANHYADILSLVYKKDNNDTANSVAPDKVMSLYRLQREMRFCPGEENGSINKEVLDKWIATFSKRLEIQDQASLFDWKLGDLFACSPKGSDGLFPHEIIREKIEEIGNDKLINAYVCHVLNERGVHYATNGEEELNLSKKYEGICDKLAIKFPKTAKIYRKLSEKYYNESKNERLIAENRIY